MAEIPHVEYPVTKYARERGFFVRKCQWIGRRGAPDRLIFGHGTFLFVEFKDAGERPEEHQAREHERMQANGLPVHVIDNPADGIALLDRILTDRQPATEPRAAVEYEDGADLL